MSWFPETLKDEILITRALGIKYLWIDALCIFQDSEDDSTREAAKMGNLYKFALITIAPTASSSVNTGTLGPQQTNLGVGLPWRIPESDLNTISKSVAAGDKYLDQTVFVICERALWVDAAKIPRSYWASRGWTMQEESLSSRVISVEA